MLCESLRTLWFFSAPVRKCETVSSALLPLIPECDHLIKLVSEAVFRLSSGV